MTENGARVLSQTSHDEQGVVRIHSKQKTPYDKRILGGVKIEWQIEKFWSPRDTEEFWSEGVPSTVLPQGAVWRLRLWPKWNSSELAGTNVYLHLTMPATGTLKADYHLYFGRGADGRVNSIKRGTLSFMGPNNIWAWMIDRDPVMEALQVDGSLVVVIDIEFLGTCGTSVPSSDETQQGSSVNDGSDSMEIRLLRNLLSAENITPMAAPTEPNYFEKLQNACVRMIVRNEVAIYRRVEWEDLEENAPNIADDIKAAVRDLQMK